MPNKDKSFSLCHKLKSSILTLLGFVEKLKFKFFIFFGFLNIFLFIETLYFLSASQSFSGVKTIFKKSGLSFSKIHFPLKSGLTVI